MTLRAWSFGRVGAVKAVRASLVLVGLLVALIGSWQRPVVAQPPRCVATTASGDVEGQLRGEVCAYIGVPYAAPPVGALRWRPPQPRGPWGPAPFDASNNVRQCPQFNATTGMAMGNEDCLLLNVWAPATRSFRRPVLVWLHTGAFQAAGSNMPATDGRRFAEERGVVVVAPNYRLGALGFLAHSALTSENAGASGNYGLADQRAALEWVRDNIAAFGGDPGNVTIDGTSAGAVSVTLHLASRASRGLFHRAIMQSTYAMSRWPTLSEREAEGDALAAALGCTDRATAAACLRGKSFAEVVVASRVAQQQFVEQPSTILWGPAVDGVEIRDQPRELYRRGDVARIPVIVGVNGDEGWTYVDRSFPSGLDELQYERAVRTEFGMDASAILERYPAAAFPTPKDALARLTADVEFVCEARRIARYLHHNGSPVYFYSFEYSLPDITSGRAAHGLESNFVFGNDYTAAPNIGITGLRPLTAADRVLYAAISSYWKEFAATGSPNVPGTPVPWPVFESDLFGAPRVPAQADRYLRFDRIISVGSYLRDSQCNFWERFYFRSVLGTVAAAAR